MDIILSIIVIAFIASIFGYVFGFLGANLKKIITEKKIIKNAKKVIKGEIKNIDINENGKEYEVKKFKLRDDDGKEFKVNLGGEILENE